MERLTWRNKKGLAFFDDDGVLIRGANGTFHQKKDMTAHYIHDRFVALDKTIDRLAAYEDTGLEPEEIDELVHKSYGPLHKKLGAWISAEKDGRLVALPCRKGDIIWGCLNCAIHKITVTAVAILDDTTIINTDWCGVFSFSDIGKTIFLTRDEAVSALKQQNRGEQRHE